jgi:asparagine synthase (glutamine-hydrolysing)
MLYHEGWGVGKMKHSLTYSGGLSRGYMRTYTTADSMNFNCFSPYTLANVIEIAEGIPFIELTGWDHEKLYALKGQVVASGVKAITGMEMPVFEKRRFQHGAASRDAFQAHFPEKELDYRKEFLSIYE